MTQTIYCDESGATGNDLLDAEQPFFVYSALALSSQRAEDLVRRMRADFSLSGEVKGANLLKHDKGRRAITWLLGECTADARLIICDKKYALACKLFEYIFEPVLASWSRPFYESKFHLFVSHLLWAAFEARSETASSVLARFQALMRERDEARLAVFLAPEGLATSAVRELRQIVAFAAGNRDAIWEEIESLAGEDPTGRWILDLTMSSLFSLLRHWGRHFDALEVYCDDSKPLRENLDVINSMSPPTETHTETHREDLPRLVTFRLAKPIARVKSIQYPGIQIADVFASAVRHALANPSLPDCKGWLAVTHECVDEESVLPQEDWKHVGSGQVPNGRVHGWVLDELEERTRQGISLSEGFGDALRRRQAEPDDQ